jgi:protein involved in polysaccharide export with SLBB domain
MNIAPALRGWLGLPDPRTEQEIDADLDAEIAFHIEQIERELIEAGESPERARVQALERFGDVERIKRRCRRIALEERTMLQRINAVLMVVVLIALVGVSVQMFFSQRSSAKALEHIAAQIAAVQPSTPTFAPEPRVRVEGDVEHPGWYAVSIDPPTLLHELVDRAGSMDANGSVSHRRAGGERGVTYSIDALLADDPPKIVVGPGDEVRVSSARERTPARLPAAYRPLAAGRWIEIDSQGRPIEGGATLEVIAPEDILNLRGRPFGLLSIPAHDITLDLTFERVSMPNLRIGHPQTGSVLDRSEHALHVPGFFTHGRWLIDEDSVLALNLGQAVPQLTEPLQMMHVRITGEPHARSASLSFGTVYLEGAVERPGAYALPQRGQLTLRRLLASAGGVNPTTRIDLIREDEAGTKHRIFSEHFGNMDPLGEDLPLLRNDLVVVVSLLDQEQERVRRRLAPVMEE